MAKTSQAISPMQPSSARIRKSYSTLTSPSRSRTNFRKRLLQLISLQASSTRRRFSFGTPPTIPSARMATSLSSSRLMKRTVTNGPQST